jgi:NAD(P)-dependent dehydrogenase (short-subunit alcohol dehydrogenase family)
MDKPICLITGATDGIGKVTATALARKGYAVVLAARNEAKAATVTREIVASTGNRDVGYLTADLTSLAQLHRLAETYMVRYPRLDVLINNAGIVMPQRVLTEDGYETTFQVNYLAQFYLTQLLLNELKKSPAGRVINLSSSVYRAGKFDPDNLQSEQQFSTIGTYAASKLCVLLFTIEMAHRLRPTRVTANAVHPGIVRTPMMRGALRAISYVLPFAVSGQRRRHVGFSPARLMRRGFRTVLHERQVEGCQDRLQHTENRELLWT